MKRVDATSITGHLVQPLGYHAHAKRHANQTPYECTPTLLMGIESSSVQPASVLHITDSGSTGYSMHTSLIKFNVRRTCCSSASSGSCSRCCRLLCATSACPRGHARLSVTCSHSLRTWCSGCCTVDTWCACCGAVAASCRRHIRVRRHRTVCSSQQVEGGDKDSSCCSAEV